MFRHATEERLLQIKNRKQRHRLLFKMGNLGRATNRDREGPNTLTDLEFTFD